MLAHDEIRQWSPVALDIADKPQRHPRPCRVLDADNLSDKVQSFLAGKVEIELGRKPRRKMPRRPHKQPASRDILDKAVDYQSAIDAKLSTGPDRDSNCCPLVHVVKATLSTHFLESNPF